VTTVKRSILTLYLAALSSSMVAAQTPTRPPAAPARTPTAATAVAPPVPKDYLIGIEDVLSVVFWRDKDMSADVVVRPDGKISLPMLNDLAAAGMTPEQLAENVQRAATKFVREPGATVIVKEIRSRKVYVIGQVAKPGTFPLGGDMNVLQMIAEAGGFLEDAKKDEVTIVRSENGTERRYRFNYDEVIRGKRPQQNFRLAPGDTIIVR
jgi:polysaccharide export outer membrane protein